MEEPIMELAGKRDTRGEGKASTCSDRGPHEVRAKQSENERAPFCPQSPIPYPLSYSLPRWALQSSGGEITTLLVLPTTGKVGLMGNVHFPWLTNRRDTQSHPRSPMDRRRCCCCCRSFFIFVDYAIVELFSRHVVSFGCVIVLCVNRASCWIPKFIFLFRPLPRESLRIYRYYFRSFLNF